MRQSHRKGRSCCSCFAVVVDGIDINGRYLDLYVWKVTRYSSASPGVSLLPGSWGPTGGTPSKELAASVTGVTEVPRGVYSPMPAMISGDGVIIPDCPLALINDTRPSIFLSSSAVFETAGFRLLRRRTVSAGRHSLFKRRHLKQRINVGCVVPHEI